MFTMAFDYCNKQIYNIDYERLKEFYSSFPIFKNKNLQEIYIDRWLKEIKENERIVEEEVNTPEKLQKLMQKIWTSQEFEIFQQRLIFGSENILLHFRVSAINKIIDFDRESLSNSVKVPISKFTDKNTQFIWHPVEINGSFKAKNRPVIAVPLLQGQYNYLVIDGNHRISSAIRKEEKNIDVLFVSEESVIDLKILASSFDYLFYIFNNELNHLANRRIRKNLPDEELLKLSYLSDGTYKMNN